MQLQAFLELWNTSWGKFLLCLTLYYLIAQILKHPLLTKKGAFMWQGWLIYCENGGWPSLGYVSIKIQVVNSDGFLARTKHPLLLCLGPNLRFSRTIKKYIYTKQPGLTLDLTLLWAKLVLLCYDLAVLLHTSPTTDVVCLHSDTTAIVQPVGSLAG